MLATGLPAASAAIQLYVNERSLLSTTDRLVAGGGGCMPVGLKIPSPSTMSVSNVAVPSDAVLISCRSPISIGAPSAASGRVIVAPGTGVQGSLALAFSK